MSAISKLIKLWAIGKFFSAGTPIVYSLLMRLAALIFLGVVIAVLFASCIAGGLYFTYGEMLAHGIVRHDAAAIIASAAAVILLSLSLGAWICWGKLTQLTGLAITRHAPLSHRVNQVVHSFIDGLLGQDER